MFETSVSYGYDERTSQDAIPVRATVVCEDDPEASATAAVWLAPFEPGETMLLLLLGEDVGGRLRQVTEVISERADLLCDMSGFPTLLVEAVDVSGAEGDMASDLAARALATALHASGTAFGAAVVASSSSTPSAALRRLGLRDEGQVAVSTDETAAAVCAAIDLQPELFLA